MSHHNAHYQSYKNAPTATALTKTGTGNILVVMLGYADVVTSIGAAFGDAVVGVGNLQPLLHLVSPDHYPPLYSLHPLQQ